MPFSDVTPKLELLPGERWRLAEVITYTLRREVQGLRKGLAIKVPAGYLTDLASIPRLLWPILPPHGNYAPAAIIHDWLYSRHGVARRPITRAQADAVLLAGMEELGDVSWGVRWMIYLAVRVGAWWAW